MPDEQTIALYTARAAEYAETVSQPAPSERLLGFIAAMPAGGATLDLGCGPGNAAAAMAAAGLRVDALDASAGMVEVARQTHGIAARVGTFDDVAATPRYHGIWANFSLLHAPRAEMPAHLSRLHAALHPGGLLHIGLKTGEGEGRDRLGRFYTYYTEAEIGGLLRAAGFAIETRDSGAEPGFDGVVAPWIVLWARRPA